MLVGIHEVLASEELWQSFCPLFGQSRVSVWILLRIGYVIKLTSCDELRCCTTLDWVCSLFRTSWPICWFEPEFIRLLDCGRVLSDVTRGTCFVLAGHIDQILNYSKFQSFNQINQSRTNPVSLLVTPLFTAQHRTSALQSDTAGTDSECSTIKWGGCSKNSDGLRCASEAVID